MHVLIPQNRDVFGGAYFAGLSTTLRAAQDAGNQPVVLEPSACAAVDELRRHFHPRSFPAGPDLMHWWFEQWLLLEQWMRREQVDVVFKIDSDVLVFDDLQAAWESLGRPEGNVPTASSFVTRSTAERYRDYILRVFREGIADESIEPGGLLGDDGLLQPYAARLGFPNLCYQRELFVDNNLFLSPAAEAFEGHKDIWFVAGQPLYVGAGLVRRCVSLHCWGEAKTRLARIYAQAQASRSGPPVRLQLF